MSICCGASKIGSIGKIERNNIVVHNVPILYCPVCKNKEPHPKIKNNLDFISEIAKEDGYKEIDLDYYIDGDQYGDLFEECATVKNGNEHQWIQSQIDMSLDLLSFSRQIKDIEWETILKKRLTALSKERDFTKNK